MRGLLRTAKRLMQAQVARARALHGQRMTRRRVRSGVVDGMRLDVPELKRRVLGFVERCHAPEVHFAAYRYSQNTTVPTLYGSAYAAMIFSLLGEMPGLPEERRKEWVAYFDERQDAATGLFIDPVLDGEGFRIYDWWGARHLALHMVTAYNALGARTRYPFHFVREYYDTRRLRDWLDGFAWHGEISHAIDIDNRIMNVGCLMQYQRDFWDDAEAGAAVAFLQEYLAERINPVTGMWGGGDLTNPDVLSRVAQFAYHLFPLFFYDSIPLRHPEAIVRHVLRTQNESGGYGVPANSSACEDIDSIELLVRLADQVPQMKAEVDASLAKGLKWVMSNQMADGGFVFRQYEPFTYGHREMHSGSNIGAMFPTWFRTLSIALLARHMSIDGFTMRRAPGMEY